MNVNKAEAQLALANAEERYLSAKAAYRSDSDEKEAFVEARDDLVNARNDWRLNYRTALAGSGDAVAEPEPVSVSLEVN